jgi:hypothetical protein
VTVMIVETETGTTAGIGTGIGMIVAGTTATAIVAGTLQHSPGNFYSSSPSLNFLYALNFFVCFVYHTYRQLNDLYYLFLQSYSRFAPPQRNPQYRLIVENLSSSCSWQVCNYVPKSVHLPPAALAIWLAFWSLLLCPRCSSSLIWPLVIALLSRMVACYGFFWILILEKS